MSLSLKRGKIPSEWVGFLSFAIRCNWGSLKRSLVSLCWVRDIGHIPSAKRLPHICDRALAAQASRGKCIWIKDLLINKWLLGKKLIVTGWFVFFFEWGKEQLMHVQPVSLMVAICCLIFSLFLWKKKPSMQHVTLMEWSVWFGWANQTKK